MPVPRSRTAILLSILVVAEAAVIWILLSSPKVPVDSPMDHTVTVPPRAKPAEVTPVAPISVAEGVSSEEPTDRVAHKLAADLAGMIERGELTAAVKVVSDGSHLSDSFAEVFGLSPTERSALDDAVISCRNDYLALQAKYASVTTTSNGSVQIQVVPFPQEGGELLDRLSARFGQVLGPERMRLFAQLTGDQLEVAFDHFGAVDHKVIFSRSMDDQGRISFVAVDQTKRGTGMRVKSFPVADLPRLTQMFPHLVVLLPPSFGRGE